MPTGELTKEDFDKVEKLKLIDGDIGDAGLKEVVKLTQLTKLWLALNGLTSVKGLEKLTKLKLLDLEDNPALTKAQIAELQKALPNCRIYSDPTK